MQMLVLLTGRQRTEAEMRVLLKDAGFRLTKMATTPSDIGEISVLEALPLEA